MFVWYSNVRTRTHGKRCLLWHSAAVETRRKGAWRLWLGGPAGGIALGEKERNGGVSRREEGREGERAERSAKGCSGMLETELPALEGAAARVG